ncbi:MAG: SCO family protein [Thiogranum sp.]|nr:SCO family protein [Thiogranum sp.]
MSEKKTFPYGTLVLFGSWGVLLILMLWWMYPDKPIPPELQGVLRPHPKILQPVELIDQHGRPFTLERLRDNWSFVFFGYTYCPDICPTTLSMLSGVTARLRSESQTVSREQVVFVSVDPERDQPAVLDDYLKYFSEAFVGVTGARGAIDNLAGQFNAGYVREAETQPGQYLVSHASSIFLVDPDARLVAAFAPPHDVDTIVGQYRLIRARY